MVAVLLCCAIAQGAKVKAWELPAGAEVSPAKRDGWKEAAAGAALAGGAALENGNLVVVVAPGAKTAALFTKPGEGAPTKVEIAIIQEGGTVGTVEKVGISKLDAGGGTLRISAGSANADITLQPGRCYVTATPGKGAARVEVRAEMRFALLPDWFANDVVYCPDRYQAERLLVPAENFLLGLIDGGSAMVMSVWQGSLTLGKKEEKEEIKDEGKDPEVHLLFAGEGKDRKVAAGRIELLGKPVHIAVLQHANLWHHENVAAWNAQEPRSIAWQRPFDAKWRMNQVAAGDKRSSDFFSQTLSREFVTYKKDKVKWKAERGLPLHFLTCRQGLWPYYIGPAWFAGKGTWLSLYADRGVRKKTGKPRKGGPFCPNMYEHVLIYPLDRVAETPVEVFTPVDIMRDTLGQGPCEYVLDLQGLKHSHHGGKKKLMFDTATCAIRDSVINPMMKKDVRTLKEGETLSAEKKERLLGAVESMFYFVKAVNERIHQYDAFNKELMTVLEEAGKNEKTRSVVDVVAPIAQAMRKDLQGFLPRADKGIEDWGKKVLGIMESVKADKYGEAGYMTKICPFAEGQDVMMAKSHRYARGIRSEVSRLEATDLDTIRLVTKIRDLSRNIMRNPHPME
jgi:hypothetical protein